MATSGETLELNRRVIEGVAAALSRFPSYNILIQGHANLINFDDPEAARIEQQEVLLPLSRRRAEMVRQALVQRGIQASRLEIEAVGANQPAAPFDDPDARHRNRRVVFYLDRR
jgi:outer membrane protein OmpA-like peptidoglycan-associated protein